MHGKQEGHLDLADFRKALAKLPEEQREVLIMVGASGLSYEEAAEICGVRSARSRAGSIARALAWRTCWPSSPRTISGRMREPTPC